MIRSFIRLSLRLYILIIVFAVILLVMGLSQLRQMPVDVYPEFNPPLVEVQTEALGLSAAEMEALITVPLEADLLNGVAWLDQIYSESVTGLSSILLIFEPGTDPIAARQMVQERLTQTFALPNVSKPPTMLQPLSATSRVMMVGLSSEDLSLIDIGVLARWNIKPRLMGVPGVANVAIWGLRERQLQVQVDPKTLNARGVTLSQVIQTTGEALWFSPLSFLESSTPGTAGWIDTPNQRLSIRHELPISSSEDLSKVALVGKPNLLLGDVTTVVEDHQPLIGDAILKDGPGILLVIEKFPGANTLEVTRGVEEALSAMRPGLTGIDIDATVFRPANYIEAAIGNLSKFILAGVAAIAFVLIVFFRNWRRVLVALLAITMSLASAVFILYLSGATFNAMVLAGLTIALGVIIDDAIIDQDSIFQSIYKKSKGKAKSFVNIIFDSIVRTRTPIYFATLIILLAVAPVFFLKDLSGDFLQPLALSFSVAVIVSGVTALLITPALSLILNGVSAPKRSQFSLVTHLERIYNQMLTTSLKSPRRIYSAIGVIAIVTLLTLPFLKTSLVPTFKETDLLIEWEAVPGTSREEMARITTQVSAELKSLEAVMGVGAHVGRAITGDAVVGMNSAELWVNLEPETDYDAAISAIGEVIDGYPGVFRELSTYQPEKVGEALMIKDEDITVRIYGWDLDVLQNLAEELSQSISQIDGVVETHSDTLIEEPQVEIEVDLVAAERRQIKPGDVRRATATLLSGLQVGNLYEEQKVFDVVVWGKPEIRGSLTDIEKLMIDTPNGQVPLGELADVRIVPAPIIIKRDIVSRFIDVEVNVEGRRLGAIQADVNKRLKNLEFPLEYHAEILGEYGQKEASQKRMLGVVLAVAIGIYLLLQASFNNFRLASISFLSLPIALSGGVLATFFVSRIFSLGSLFGFLAVFAIAVRNSILTINHLQYLENEGASKDSLIATVATSSSLGLALLPLAIFGNVAGGEILQPMAIVILGGIITSLFVNLFVTPSVYFKYSRIPMG